MPSLTQNYKNQYIIYKKPIFNQANLIWIRDIMELEDKITNPNELTGQIYQNEIAQQLSLSL
jgi:hypothetical protein